MGPCVEFTAQDIFPSGRCTAPPRKKHASQSQMHKLIATMCEHYAVALLDALWQAEATQLQIGEMPGKVICPQLLEASLALMYAMPERRVCFPVLSC